MIARLLALAALILAGPALAAPKAGELQLIDTTGAFTRAWEATAALRDGERPAAFRARMEPTLPGFYTGARMGMTPEAYDARILARLKQFPERRAEMEAVSARFRTMLDPARASFEKAFGPMRGYPPLYLVNSLGEFDGGTRELHGQTVLMFGADVIARIHTDHDIQPFFHHELFHLYHHRFFPECEAIWCGLWAEGLATYAAKALNPRATDAELLLTTPEPLRAAVERDRKGAVCAVTARLGSTAQADYSALFSSGRLGPTLPPRFAYYVGFLVAEEIGRTHSLKAMAQMKPSEARRQIEAALGRLADCSKA
jgi:hypothetical protein